MKRLSEFLSRNKFGIYDLAWLAMPVLVWFSYYPNIHLGQDSTMFFEISLPLIGLVVLALVSLPSIWRKQVELAENKFVWVAAALVLFSAVTMLWTANPLRGFLTVGVMLLLFAVFLGAVARRDELRKLLPKLTRVFVTTAVVMSGLAIIQFLLGIWLPQDFTLLCNGCVSQQFGFPRPNGLAIEPQFLGSLLLAPILVVAHRFMAGKSSRLEAWSLPLMLLAMFLTMSRGAIYALALGVIILLILHRRKFKKIAFLVGISLGSLMVSLVMQGGAATLSPVVAESFSGGVYKSVDQLTLGAFDIKKPAPEVTDELEPQEQSDKDAPAFDGYVEESTEIRANRTDLSLRAWSRDVTTMLFGAGVGSAGTAMHEVSPETIGAREIVQNEYIERLLERGLVGLGLFVAMIALILYKLRYNRWLWSIVAAFLLQWVLFSGYPNALHIYLILIVFAVMIHPKPNR